jgi:prepilin-type N-terminal cleavage/methylation domain-containing protein
MAPIDTDEENSAGFRGLCRENHGTEAGLMRPKNTGFSMLELMVVILILMIIAAIAIPQAWTAIKIYKLHSDATSVSSMLNVARMEAASNYAPFRLVVNVAAGSYWDEHLCGNVSSTTDSNCTSAYMPFSTTNIPPLLVRPKIVSGTQYLSSGNSFASCLPSVVTAGHYPGELSANPSGCPTNPDPFYIYFNTRGSPVDNSGNPLTNGGAAIYFTNRDNEVDAVTVAIGGGVAIYNWDKVAGAWEKR